eukprot:4956444-Heterocapsa_arctica.AAC.1
MLDAEKVKKARSEELDWGRKMGVWEKTPRATMEAAGGRAISLRWVDTDKGDHTRPAYRSRGVAREIKKAIRASEVPPASD